MQLYYGDDREYAVELYDRVEMRRDGKTFDGVVTKIHNRSHEVTVRFEDHLDVARTTGNPRRKSARAPIGAVDLVGRDG